MGQIHLRHHQNIAVLEIENPGRLNAFSRAMRAEIGRLLGRLNSDASVMAAVVTRRGDDAFCAGQDLNESVNWTEETPWVEEFDTFFRDLLRFQKPLVGAINGVAAGGGFQMALLFDCRVGHPGVKMGQPEVKRGLASVTGTWLLQRSVGDMRARELALSGTGEGADVITTTCGFLVALQKEIAPKLRVPFVASSLLQIPLVHALVRGRVAILTANDEALTRAHLNAAGVAADTPLAITGLQGYAPFADPLLRGIVPQMDIAAVETCVGEAVTGLMARYPDIRAFVCECNNLPPFSHAVRKQTGRPVFDILTLVVAALGNRGVSVLRRHSPLP